MRAETQHFTSRIELLPDANAFVTACLDRFHAPAATQFSVLLALEEAFVNICHHAYAHGEGDIEIICAIDNGAFVLEIADRGKPFDVLSLPDPDTSLGIEERPVGGLGLYLIRTLTSNVSYKRENDQNRLRMVFGQLAD